MIFYFNSDGKLINSVPSNVYQGSNKASRIYFVCPTAQSNVISVAFTLPSGLYSSKRMLTRTELTGDGIGLSSGNGKVVNEEDVGFNVWQYDIPFSVTEYAGQVTVQFFIDNGTGTTVATQSVMFLVEKGSGVVPPNISDDEYQEIVETIAGYYQDTDNNIRELDTRLSQEIAEKQDALVSGVNIKTINGQSLLGAGDIIIQGGGGSGGTIVVDEELSSTSPNPVENRAITKALNDKQDKLTIDASFSLYSTNPVENRVITKALDDKQVQIRQLSQVLNTKPTEFFVSVNDTFSNGVEGAKWFDYDGNDITSQIGTGDYVNSNCRNSIFNSQETSVSIPPDPTQFTFIIARRQTERSIEYIVLTASQLGGIDNKIIRIIEQNIPDRSGQGTYTYYEVKGALNDYSRYGTYTVSVNSWVSTSAGGTYTHSALVAIGSVLTVSEIENKNCVFTLFNNNPALFAEHGFAVQSAYNANGVATAIVLSIGAPDEAVTFSFKGEVIE